ncbi:MAG: hypothetical protein ACOX2F_06215 [bacterium]
MRKIIFFLITVFMFAGLFGQEKEISIDDIIRIMDQNGIDYSFPNTEELWGIIGDSKVSFMMAFEFVQYLEETYRGKSYTGVSFLACTDEVRRTSSYFFGCSWDHVGTYTGVSVRVQDATFLDYVFTAFRAYSHTSVYGNLSSTSANWFIATARAYNLSYVYIAGLWTPIFTYIGNTQTDYIRNCSGQNPC